MGTVPSDLDKNKKGTEMDKLDDSDSASKVTEPPSSSPPPVEEMEEDNPTSNTTVMPSSPPRIEVEEEDNTVSSETTVASAPSSSPPRIEDMEEDGEKDNSTSKTTPVATSPPNIEMEEKEISLASSETMEAPSKHQENVEHSSSDSVNVTDMPTEGPQETEQADEEKEVEPKEDKPSSQIPIASIDDHTYSAISTSTKDDIQPCSSALMEMETSSTENPEVPPPPESTIEIATSTTQEVDHEHEPPSKEVDRERVKYLGNEVTRLETELTLERSTKQELSSQLLQSQTQFTTLSSQLSEAASIIIEQQKAVGILAEKESLLESLQSDLVKEREEKSVIQLKYDKQQRKLVSLTKEFNEIFSELQTHFANCCKPKEQNEEDPSNMSWMSNQQLQNKLDQLTSSVQERYQFWTNQQREMEEELSGTRKTMEELIELLEGMEEISPKEKFTPPQPPPQKIEPPSSSPPPNPPVEIEHGVVDPSKKYSSPSKHFCLCGREFFSGGSLHCHIKRFTGEQKYICEVCSKGFVYPSDLKSHKLTHKKVSTPKTTPKRTIWSCEFCSNSFFKADIYQSHIKTCGTATPGTSSASPPTILVASSDSSTSNSPPAPVNTHDYSSDDDITILEDDSTFTSTPSFSIPLRQQAPNPSPSNFPAPVMSRVAQLYMSSSPISILPTPPPVPLPPGIVKVVQHTPIAPPTTSATSNSFASKKHSRDITKRHIGFFCICGIKFISRKRLDGHLTFRNGRIEDGSSNRRFKPLTLAQIKTEKAMSSHFPPKVLGGNLKKSISKRGGRGSGGRPKSKKKHGVEPTNSLKCLCGKMGKSVTDLLRHIRYYTATKTIPCEYCDKLFLSNSFLNCHYKTAHKVELMTTASFGAAAAIPVPAPAQKNGTKKKSKPKKFKKKTTATAETSTSLEQVHRLDYSKSHRGNFCKCGRKFSSKRKLNIHLYRKNSEEGGEGSGKGDTENLESPSWKKQGNSKEVTPVGAGVVAAVVTGSGSSKFTCMTCGEHFASNMDRIRHRVQAHGHGLF